MTHTYLTAALLLAILLSTATTSLASDKAKPSAINTLVKGNNAFAVQLYHQLSSTKGNLFFSPYSMSSALSMTYAGARGNTATEMKAALSVQLEQPQLHSAFKKLNKELMANARKTDQKLNIANGLCLTGGNVSKEFKALLKDSYDAELFKGGLDRINAWVKKKTEGKIDKILDKLSANTVCVLLNAVYFKGSWQSQFKKQHTRNAPFNTSSQEQATLPLMYQLGNFRLLAKNDFQAISIPYKGKLISMIVLLPKNVDGLATLEKDLTTNNLKQWLSELDRASSRKLQLFIPKFKIKTGYDLVPSCKKLGMSDAFNAAEADFSGMGWPKGALWIAQIKHKAFVQINEEGTEAAAATAVEMQTRSAPAHRPLVFRADHPFLFLIRDNQTGSILFMGRMAGPESE